ncbi:putative toxin-antitoxin system toxin component, PIN family [Mucilaginibacter sp. PAMB04168]|uniref:putative toxin-antitoxin system toxin component, PIN family n=1 Tax=Mucilaginibacter sp. PAMB04168 TaxID=3138567 RepID=UPI0031F6141F
MIVVIDCNIWITLSINGQIDFIADLSDNGIIVATCSTLRNEITNVLGRPKLAKFLSPSTILKVVDLHDTVTTIYPIGKIEHVVADLKDNYLFTLSETSKADYLITGDKLLLEVRKHKKTTVITLADFRIIAQ